MNDERVTMNDAQESEDVILSVTKNLSLEGISGRFFTSFGMTGVNKAPAGSTGLCHFTTLQLCN